MYKLVLISIVLSFSANAASGKKHAKSVPKYLDANGKELEVTQALISSIQGEKVYKCTEVESNVSKSGTSISLKSKKAN